jgi:hypothetical protein
LQSVSVTDVPLKVRIVVDSIVGAIKIQDSDTNASFGRITSSGTYEFVSTSNQPNVVIARDNGSVDTNAVISSFEIIELTGTYQITNFTDAVRDDAINLNTGLQTCFWKRDTLGVPTGSSFNKLECDGVGYAGTSITLPDNYYMIEFIAKVNNTSNYQKLCTFTEGVGITNYINGAFYIYPRYDDGDYNCNIHIPSTEGETGHYIFEILEKDNVVTANGYKNGILYGTRTYEYTSKTIATIYKMFYEYYGRDDDTEIRLFKIHTELQDPLELYNKAVNKGLLQ